MTLDPFSTLARYYDRIMAHVDYDRWYLITLALGGLLSFPFRHVDVACGTGTLVKRLQKVGWNTIGVDLSPAMVRMGRKTGPAWPGIVGDLRALPLQGSMDFATCLFDSLNFVLDEGEMQTALGQLGACLQPGGLLYFDFVTEQMVLQHFAGQRWTEDNGPFSTSWANVYDRETGVTDTEIRVNNGVANTIRERIHSRDAIEDGLAQAGLSPLAILDAETWRKPRRKTIRVDVVAVKGDPKDYRKAFRGLRREIEELMRTHAPATYED
jgi:SAM-dependent methyltransferase